ncbi:MAG: hypothetical protein NC308_03420, partial [Clostridium sp.]|nr:hypothetical protein [Clostridium sp.]
IDNVTTATHSHPSEPYPSENDKRVVRMFKKHNINFMIFHKPTSRYIEYNAEGALYKKEDYEAF